ncbi:MAG: DNA starvation/stationary phase protection protein [Planctomycetes bacterium]|nr:DNA starvation/stationary phase protection protein [Planctomycetota bacterium]
MSKPEVLGALNQLLADHQVLYQKLRGFHWNVQGQLFFTLHGKFEELYDEMAERVDALAERIVTLGGKPLATLKAQLEKARLSEDAGTYAAPDMVRHVVADLEKVDQWLRSVAAMASEAQDPATANLLEGFADGQEKTVWMLKAFLR